MCNAKRLNITPNQIEVKARQLGLPVIWPDAQIPNLQPHAMTRPTNVLPVFRLVDPAQPTVGITMAMMRWWMGRPSSTRGPT